MTNQELSPMVINFFGQFVTIITKKSISATTNTEHGPIVETNPFILQGVLIDEDEDHYYFGRNMTEVTGYVCKSEVLGMEIVEELDELEQVLDQMEIPENDEGVN